MDGQARLSYKLQHRHCRSLGSVWNPTLPSDLCTAPPASLLTASESLYIQGKILSNSKCSPQTLPGFREVQIYREERLPLPASVQTPRFTPSAAQRLNTHGLSLSSPTAQLRTRVNPGRKPPALVAAETAAAPWARICPYTADHPPEGPPRYRRPGSPALPFLPTQPRSLLGPTPPSLTLTLSSGPRQGGPAPHIASRPRNPGPAPHTRPRPRPSPEPHRLPRAPNRPQPLPGTSCRWFPMLLWGSPPPSSAAIAVYPERSLGSRRRGGGGGGGGGRRRWREEEEPRPLAAPLREPRGGRRVWGLRTDPPRLPRRLFYTAGSASAQRRRERGCPSAPSWGEGGDAVSPGEGRAPPGGPRGSEKGGTEGTRPWLSLGCRLSWEGSAMADLATASPGWHPLCCSGKGFVTEPRPRVLGEGTDVTEIHGGSPFG